MTKKTDKKQGDEFTLMRQIYDYLEYLDYEREFDPVSRKLPYLTPTYFAVQQQNPKTQFDYFSGLCIWMMQKYFKLDIETPTDYDQPATVTDNLIAHLPKIGFKITFQANKLTSGSGIAVCQILDALCRLSLNKSGFKHQDFRVVSGLGGSGDEVETRGDDDEDGIIDDIVDVQEDDEGNEDTGAIDYGTDSQTKVIDSLELKAEAERVAPRLQIRIPAEKSDWRTHFSQMTTHHKSITDLMVQLTPILTKVGGDVTQAITLIENREKMLNTRFEQKIVDYSTRAKLLESIEKKHRDRVQSVNTLKSELENVIDKLSKTKESLDEKRKEASDNSPLMSIKTASTKLREEIKQLELRSAILQRSLTQSWLDEKESLEE